MRIRERQRTVISRNLVYSSCVLGTLCATDACGGTVAKATVYKKSNKASRRASPPAYHIPCLLQTPNNALPPHPAPCRIPCPSLLRGILRLKHVLRHGALPNRCILRHARVRVDLLFVMFQGRVRDRAHFSTLGLLQLRMRRRQVGATEQRDHPASATLLSWFRQK